MVSRNVAKTRTALGFGLVGLSGLAVNQLLFWLLTEVGSFWISWGAILATQGSTVWNFVLNDRFVYAGVGGRDGRYGRFVKSWTTNTVSLVFRVPLLLALAHAGMNPHWANITTLVVLFGLRFWISDRFIWNSKRIVADVTGEPVVRPTPADVLVEMKRDELGPHMALNLRPRRRTKRHYYNIHGIVHIAVGGRSCRSWSYFKVAAVHPQAGHHRASWIRRRPTHDQPRASHQGARRASSTASTLGSMGVNFRVDLDNRIVVTVSPLLARSHHVVYTNVVEALQPVRAGEQGLHAAALGDRPARGNDSHHALGADGHRQDRHHPAADAGAPGIAGFLSDDMTIINGTGGGVVASPSR